MEGEATESSDVFAYGMTLWEMAARRYQYEKAHGHAALIIHYITSGQREKIPEGTPPAFAEVIGNCWAQDPAARWDLQRAIATLRGKKPSASPPKGKLAMDSFVQNSEM